MCTPTLCTEQRQCTCVYAQFHLLELVTSHAVEAGSAHIHMCIVCVTVWLCDTTQEYLFPREAAWHRHTPFDPARLLRAAPFILSPLSFHSLVYNWAICAKPDSCTFSSYIVQKIPHTLTLLLYTCVIWVLGLCHYVFLCHLSFVFVKILLYVSKSPLASTIHHSWMKKATLKISQLKTFPINWDVEMLRWMRRGTKRRILKGNQGGERLWGWRTV